MNRRQTAGFTLIEVLVSLFILGFGIMGAAAMQLTALRTAQHSDHQTAALRLAIELADAMRAFRHMPPRPNSPSDPHSEPDSDLDNPYLGIDFGPGFEALTTDSATSHCFATCGAADAVTTHIRDWSARLSHALPAARAKVCRDAKPWNSDKTSYTWDCHAGTKSERSAVVIKIGWRKKPGPGAEVSTAIKDTDFPPGLLMPVVLPAK